MLLEDQRLRELFVLGLQKFWPLKIVEDFCLIIRRNGDNTSMSMLQQVSEESAKFEQEKAKGKTWFVGVRGKLPCYETNSLDEAKRLAKSCGKQYVFWQEKPLK